MSNLFLVDLTISPGWWEPASRPGGEVLPYGGHPEGTVGCHPEGSDQGPEAPDDSAREALGQRTALSTSQSPR